MTIVSHDPITSRVEGTEVHARFLVSTALLLVILKNPGFIGKGGYIGIGQWKRTMETIIQGLVFRTRKS